MRFGEDNYENNFLDDFSGYGGYGGLPAATTYTPPAATYSAPMAQPMGAGALTPEQIAELQASAALMQQRIQAASDPNRNAAFDKYVADQAAKGVEVASTYTGGGGPLGSGGIFGITDFAPAFDPTNPAGTTGQVVRFDPKRMNAPVVFQPGQQYVLTDASGENVVGRASSVEELQKLAAAKENMPYGFQLYRADEQGGYKPGTQLFGETDPRTKGLMGAFVNYGLPIAAGIATGGLSLIPAAAASAAASGAAKLMTGYTPEDAAKAAAIAGVTRGVLKGTGLEDSIGGLLSAKTSGVTSSAIPAGALSGAPMSLIPAGALGGASASAIPAAAFSGLTSAAAAPVVGEILVQGARNAVSPALASAISGGLSTLAPAVFDPSSIPQFQSPDVGNAETSQQNDYQPGDDPILTSTAPRPVSTTVPPPGGALSAVSDAIRFIVDPAEVAGQIATQAATTEEPEALAEADRIKRFEAEAAAAAAAAGTGALSAAEGTLEAEALAEADRIKRFEAEAAAAAAAAAAAGGTGSASDTSNTSTDKKDGVLSKINPVRAGLSALAGLVSLLGSGGGKGGGNVPTGNAGAGTRASLDPIFSAKLPAPSAQYSGASLAPRDMRGVDFARYGYGPGASFFENVPRNPEEYRAALAANSRPSRPSGALNLPPVTLPPAAEGGTTADPTASATSLIRTYIPSATDAEIAEFLATEEGIQFLTNFGAPVPRARGGSMRGSGTSRNSYAVKGAGTGRSDEIPALLSDGEYVIDAETVAMLGDGSSEAGAKRLDDFRINVRKHKGRNLAKGKFSANAKRPEKYLAGGRA